MQNKKTVCACSSVARFFSACIKVITPSPTTIIIKEGYEHEKYRYFQPIA